MTHRLDIERAILGECLLENAFAKVADILQPQNFSDADNDQLPYSHRLIYQAFTRLYPVKPIDFLTVAHHLPNDYKTYLCQLTAGVCSANPIRYHAVLLLEISLRESFLTMLKALYNEAGPAERAALYEIQDEALDYDNDIFVVIEKAATFIQSVAAPGITARLNEFNRHLDNRIRQIRQQAHIEALLKNLSTLNLIPHDVNAKLAVGHLADTIKTILSNGTIKRGNLERILSITA